MSFLSSHYSDDADRAPDRAGAGLAFTDDLLLQIAGTLADWAVSHLGPLFWLYLAAMFLRALRGI